MAAQGSAWEDDMLIDVSIVVYYHENSHRILQMKNRQLSDFWRQEKISNLV